MDVINIYKKISGNSDGIASLLNGLSDHSQGAFRVFKQLPENYAKEDSVYVLHGCYSLDLLSNAILLFLRRKVFYWTPHGSFQKNSLYKSSIKKILFHLIVSRTIFTLCKGVIFVSVGEKDKSRWLVKDKFSLVINNGIAFHESDGPRTRGGMIYIGRIDVEHKGIDIMSEWIGEFSSDFCVYGDYSNIDSQAYDNLKFCGPIFGEEKLAVLNRSKCFVMLSRYEGLAMAAIEALRAGCVLIVSPSCNLCSVIEMYDCGFVVNSKEEFKNVVSKLNSGTHDFNRLSANARNAFVSEFLIDDTLRSYASLGDG